jgi:hypothetical protein
MRTMLLDTMFSLFKFLRLRWGFLATLLAALAFLTAAALTWNLGLAMVGAIAAFAAGEERASQILCNECALSLQVDPEVPYPVA